MALSHTILTFLSESSYSGYDLSKHFEDTVSYFWKSSHQQIYRELANMQRLGWVEVEDVPQRGKPDKKLYRITETGRTALEEWFQLPCSPSPIREDILVKVLAGACIEKSVLIQQIEMQRSLHQTKLDCYLVHEKTFLAIENPEKSLKFRYLTLRRGIRHETEWIDWCDEVLETINSY